MLPYTVIKEANPPQYSGTATGVVNFLNFTFSALLGPVFGLILKTVSGGSAKASLEHFQTTFEPLLAGVVLAVLLAMGAAVLRGRADDRIHDREDAEWLGGKPVLVLLPAPPKERSGTQG